VKNKLHLQPEWFPVVGETVEIRLDNHAVRTGRVDGVTSDDQVLWIAADGAEPRAMFERCDDYSVWIEYKWETVSMG
jgi:phosphopentomutase